MKEKYISFCKQEELTTALLWICGILIWFGCIEKMIPNRLNAMEIIVGIILSISFILIIFFISNKNMMRCYRLIRKGAQKKKAIVEYQDIYQWGGRRGSYAFVVRIEFCIADINERYVWKERYRPAMCNMALAKHLKKYLEQKPEIEVLVEQNRYSNNYVMLEQVMLDPIRRNQKGYLYLNVILTLVAIGLGAVLFV